MTESQMTQQAGDGPRGPIYELQDVSKRFGDGSREVQAVDAVDLTINSGEFVVIAGPSGSGKTTLLQLLGGLDCPTSGEVRYQGEDLSKLPEAALTELRGAAFGFVFQRFNLIPTLNAQQNVEVPLAPRGLHGMEMRAKAEALLESVGLGGRTDHLPSQLSGGEQQRVAIARALANDPRVLLADEPTGNLDTKTGQEIMTLLASLSDKQGKTVVLITHDEAITAVASSVMRMIDGRLTRSGADNSSRDTP